MIHHPADDQLERIRSARLVVRVDDIGRQNERQLSTIAELESFERPYFLAVVPEWIAPSTASLIRSLRHAVIWQHGVSHENNGEDGRKDEFPDHWPVDRIKDRLATGRALIEASLSIAPLGYIPPWNRLTGGATRALEELGFKYLSANGNRPPRAAAFETFHAKVDPIACYDPVTIKDLAEFERLVTEALQAEEVTVVTLHPAVTPDGALRSILRTIAGRHGLSPP